MSLQVISTIREPNGKEREDVDQKEEDDSKPLVLFDVLYLMREGAVVFKRNVSITVDLLLFGVISPRHVHGSPNRYPGSLDQIDLEECQE